MFKVLLPLKICTHEGDKCKLLKMLIKIFSPVVVWLISEDSFTLLTAPQTLKTSLSTQQNVTYKHSLPTVVCI